MEEEKKIQPEAEPEQEAAQTAGEQPADQTAGEQAEATPEQWQAALELAVKQRDDYLDKLQRTQADFQNFKRRNGAARTEGYDDGQRETIAAMLPTIDTLERALLSAEEHGEEGAFIEGVRMTLRGMMDALTKMGLEEIPALGEKFDPDVHNAVMRAEEGEPGTVLEVFQKGYRIKNRVIRYAMVKVSAE